MCAWGMALSCMHIYVVCVMYVCQPGILDPETEDLEAKFYSAVTGWKGEEYPLATTNIIPATLGVEKTKKGRCA